MVALPERHVTLSPILLLTISTASCTETRGIGFDQDSSTAARTRMVAEQIAARGVHDPGVLAAMRDVPRHLFVLPTDQRHAYDDGPRPIGYEQTISQPYMVALMTELLRPRVSDRALEVGTGSGYQAAVLSRAVAHVYTIEIIEPLAREAEQRLKNLGYQNVTVRVGDGYAGWPELAPFDLIVVTAAPDHVPPSLLAQLRAGGRMVIPVGSVWDVQQLQLIEKDTAGQIRTKVVAPVAFVPLRRGR